MKVSKASQGAWARNGETHTQRKAGPNGDGLLPLRTQVHSWGLPFLETVCMCYFLIFRTLGIHTEHIRLPDPARASQALESPRKPDTIEGGIARCPVLCARAPSRCPPFLSFSERERAACLSAKL